MCSANKYSKYRNCGCGFVDITNQHFSPLIKPNTECRVELGNVQNVNDIVSNVN